MTDGIRTTVDGEAWMRGIEVEPRDDGATETGETMETTKPSALAEAVFNLCAPGGQTPEAMDAVVRAVAGPSEKEQAIRLAREALRIAEEKMRIADRESMEAELALRELDGRENEPHTRYLRAWLASDFAAARAARVEVSARNFLKYGWTPAPDIADEVTTEVARIRNEREH